MEKNFWNCWQGVSIAPMAFDFKALKKGSKSNSSQS